MQKLQGELTDVLPIYQNSLQLSSTVKIASRGFLHSAAAFVYKMAFQYAWLDPYSFVSAAEGKDRVKAYADIFKNRRKERVRRKRAEQSQTQSLESTVAHRATGSSLSDASSSSSSSTAAPSLRTAAATPAIPIRQTPSPARCCPLLFIRSEEVDSWTSWFGKTESNMNSKLDFHLERKQAADPG
mmetsp:Transcript_39941/g.78745  ORF Transcript_39941/g.78745 Transcript_39941/m.78745 type:complete len:185 (-) Transcript_39941:248-802(-)